MDTQPETTASSFVYNRIPTKVSRKDFNRYIEPHLHRPKKGGIRVRRDTLVSVMYAEELHSAKSSVTFQGTDRHGILG